MPPDKSSYNEPTNGLSYISDATFIDTGVIKSISPEFKTNDEEQLWYVRSFPQGLRNCYNINNTITAHVRYLIRGTFMYGNYDAQNKLPKFGLHIGPNVWDSVKIMDVSAPIYKEIIHVPSSNYIHVCLVNNGSGTPFISTLELRPLASDTYMSKYRSLALHRRVDTGTTTNKTLRWVDLYVW